MSAAELKDVRPPLDLPADFTLWTLLGVLVISLVVFFFGRRIWQSARAAARPAPLPRSAWQTAWDELAVLEADNLPARGEIKEYFVRLSGIVRHYLERRFGFSAPEMTTDEFLEHIKASGVLNAQHKGSLKDFLTASDMVKFARGGASIEEMNKALEVAKKLVQETTPAAAENGSGAGAAAQNQARVR